MRSWARVAPITTKGHSVTTGAASFPFTTTPMPRHLANP